MKTVLLTVRNPRDPSQSFEIEVSPEPEHFERPGKAKRAARHTWGWKRLILKDGREVPFSKINAENLYANIPWLCDQVITFLDKEKSK